MMKRVRLTLICLPFLLAGTCPAQNEGSRPPGDQAKFFHLDFVVKEIEGGRVVNARTYTTSVSTSSEWQGTIRTGSKVPIPTGGGTNNTTYTFADVGVNIDCRNAKEIDGQLALTVSAEVSSVASTGTLGSGSPPIIRQNKWSSNVLVALRKPTVIFSSDDLSSKGQMQLELTATPLK